MAFKLAEAFVEFKQRGLSGVTAGIGRVAGSMRSATRLATSLQSKLLALGTGVMFAGSIRAANEQIKAERKLAAVLKATGGAAGFSAKEIEKLAAQRQKITNFGDEATLSAAAMLATFKSIKGDVFTGALVAAQDLSSVMDQDLKSSVVQIGKALNDPIRGVTALQRVGVSFTDAQKSMIKSLAETGDMAGAQAIIMRELESEFGGASVAMADSITQFGNTIGDVFENIGFALRPIAGEFADVFSEIIFGPMADSRKAFSEWGESVAESIGPGIRRFAEGVRGMWQRVQPVLAELGGLFSDVGGLVSGVFGAAFGSLDGQANTAVGVIQMVRQAVVELTPGIVSAVDTLAKFASAMTPVVVGLGGVAAGVIAAKMALSAYVGVGNAVAVSMGGLRGILGGVKGAFIALRSPILLAKAALIGFRGALITTGVGALIIGLGLLVKAIVESERAMKSLGNLGSASLGLLKTAFDLLMQVGGSFFGFLDDLFKKMFGGGDAISSVIDGMTDVVDFLSVMLTHWDTTWDLIGLLTENLIDNMVDLFWSMPSRLANLGQSIMDTIGIELPDFAQAAADKAMKFAEDLKKLSPEEKERRKVRDTKIDGLMAILGQAHIDLQKDREDKNKKADEKADEKADDPAPDKPPKPDKPPDKPPEDPPEEKAEKKREKADILSAEAVNRKAQTATADPQKVQIEEQKKSNEWLSQILKAVTGNRNIAAQTATTGVGGLLSGLAAAGVDAAGGKEGATDAVQTGFDALMGGLDAVATEARKGDLNEQRAALEAGRPKGETVGESIARNAKIHAIAKKAAAEGFETPGERATERPVFDIGKLTRPMAAETKTERVTPRSVVDTFSRTDRPTVKPAAIGTPEKSPDSRIAPGFAAELKVMHGLQREANAHLSKVVTELVATKTAITQADNDRTAILGR